NLSSFVYNYETNAGAINRVYYENGDKTIVLVLNGTMENNKEYTLTARNIRSTTNEFIEFKDKTFTANDTTPPRVTGIDVLGTTGIRINFSEPIKTVPSMTNFNINATTSLSNPVLSYKSIEIRYSTSTTLAPGTYTILTQGLEDFAGNKMNIDTRSFTIIKDSLPPEIIKSTASLDQLTLEFNELI
ncbi:Ig-like domain-containing protein, partial [Vibrio parahaemolyticus]|nr:Ig-like domain-containing protein [Vibrio parahaemolyticus]